MKRHIFYSVLLFLGWVSTNAQEFSLPLLNQYIADNPFLVSASYAGIGDCWQLRATGFEQWVGIEDAPNTQSISADGRISDRSGIGAILFNDSNGFTSQKGFQGSFAHHLTLSEYTRQYLSFGISYKYTQFNIDSSEFNDLELKSLGDITTVNHNFDVSVLYRVKSYFITLNAVNLLDKPLTDFGVNEPAGLTNYYVYTGFTFENVFKKLQFEPSILYRQFSSNQRSTLDANFKVRKFFNKSYAWAGITVRSLIDQGFKPLAISPLIGIKKSKFYFAYGYQINTNEVLATDNSGSHLITLGIDFGCRRSTCGCTY